jgi:hypothetical protein
VGEQARLCQIVEGVEFTVEEQGVLIRALILRDALENFFGANDTPQSWLRAFQTHRDAIECAAADAFRAQDEQGIVVLRADRPHDFAHVRIARPLRPAGVAIHPAYASVGVGRMPLQRTG